MIVSIFPFNILANTPPQVTQPLVALTDQHEKNSSTYQITFRTSTLGTSELRGSNNDRISVRFPSSFQVPGSINRSRVKVNDVLLTSDVTVSTDGSGNRIAEIPIPSSSVIASNSFVKVEIAKEAGILNPSTTGMYSLGVRTTRDTDWATTNSFAIMNSMISIPEVTVAPNIIGETGMYFVKFRTSSEGALNQAGIQDEIYIEFPAGTTFTTTTIANTQIRVNETNIPTAATVSGNILTLRVPNSIGAGEEVRVSVLAGAGVTHPTTPGSYSLLVSTSRDSEKNRSTTYSIETSPKKLEAWVSPSVVSQVAQFTIGLTNGNAALAQCVDSITVRFPAGTTIPSTINSNLVFVNGEVVTGKCGPTSMVTVNTSQRTVTILAPKNIIADEYVGVILDFRAGITNPNTIGSYQLEVRSTQETAYRPSQNYTLTGNAISPLTIQLLESGVGKAAEYLIQFSTSTSGGLIGGQDRIYINLPPGTTAPSNISRSNITLNNTALSNDVVVSNNVLNIIVPSTLQVPVNSQGKQDFTIKILPTAGVTNPSTPGTYSMAVYTSRDMANVSQSFLISQSPSAPAVSVSPNQFNQNGQYSVAFSLSSAGRLEGAANDHIELLFPTGTVVPNSISPAQILINGQAARSITVSGQSVKAFLPTSMTLDNSANVGMVIQSAAGIRNPSQGSYQLKVRTSKDQSFVASNSYLTVGGSSTPTPNPSPSQGNVGTRMSLELSSYEANAASQYKITYTTESNESLVGGTDDIHILFHTYVQLPSSLSRELIRVNNVALDTGVVRMQNNIMTFRLPSTVNVSGNQNVTITIDPAALIKNPALSGAYSLYVWSSKTTNMANVQYNVSSQAAQKLLVVPTYDTTRNITSYILKYSTSSGDSLVGGYDWISILAPTSLNSKSFKDNVTISVAGQTVNKNQIQVSNQDISFTLPTGVNIGGNQDVFITIEDPKSLLTPLNTGKYRFQLSTSKNSTRISSNEIEYLKAGTSTNTNPNTNTGQNGSVPTSPTTGTPNNNSGSTGSKTIQLIINQSTAQVGNQSVSLDAAPTLMNGTTMVPLRFVSETMGATVNYRAEQNRIDIQLGNKFISLVIDSDTVYTAQGAVKLPVAPKVVNGRALVPLRFVTEQMGMRVEWEGTTKTIQIFQK